METYKSRHGIDFPKEMTDFQCDLVTWKHWAEPEYAHGNVKDPHELFLSAMQQILSHSEWAVSPWTEEHVYDWTHENFIIVWGCAGSSKTNDFGLLTYVDWSLDPLETVATLASTTKDALKKRVFESTVRYHKILSSKGLGFPGTLSRTQTAVVLDPNDDIAEGESIPQTGLKMGIWGVALKDGSVAESVGNIRGTHAKYVRLMADELSQMHPAIVDPALLINLGVGARNFKFVGLTNIDAFDDLAGRNSVPVGGWHSVTHETMRWRTSRGVVRRHDGFFSPGLKEPEKYPHLLSQPTLDAFIKAENGNADSPAIWRMVRAWPPVTDTYPVPVTQAEATVWGMRAYDPTTPSSPVGSVSAASPAQQAQPPPHSPGPMWAEPPLPIAALDPGFGGDRCILQPAYVGTLLDGRRVVWFTETVTLNIQGSSGNPVIYQIVSQAAPYLDIMNIAPQHFCVDDSGPQNVADVIEKEWRRGIQRFSFGGRPTELPVSAYNVRTAAEWYGDAITEAVFLYREFGQYRQVLNVPTETLAQLTRRRVDRRAGRRVLVPKQVYKKETGLSSPDNMDAGAMCLFVARTILGLCPGSNEFMISGEFGDAQAGSAWLNPAYNKRVNNI